MQARETDLNPHVRMPASEPAKQAGKRTTRNDVGWRVAAGRGTGQVGWLIAGQTAANLELLHEDHCDRGGRSDCGPQIN